MVKTGSGPSVNQADLRLLAKLSAWAPKPSLTLKPIPEAAKTPFRDDAIPLRTVVTWDDGPKVVGALPSYPTLA